MVTSIGIIVITLRVIDCHKMIKFVVLIVVPKQI